MAKQQTLTMVTLGRPLHLGMLYDIRSDKMIAGVTLWDPQSLANNTVTRKHPYTGFEIITEDSLQAKAHALGVDASLKLSMLGGLLSISGSAKYADDYQKTNHEARLTLKYSTTTHIEELTMKRLGKGNLNHPDLHDTDIATHVVTGVLYGAEAFFIFDRTVAHGESKKKISGELKVILDKLPTFKIEGAAKLNLTDNETNFVDKLRCKFYGDFRLNENPSTFADAVRIYRQLPSLVGANNENAIPKKVWLYPLHLLDNKARRIFRNISSNLIDYSISVIKKLHSLEVKALDLSNSAMFTHFNHMKKHLLDFTTRLSEFQRDSKEKIALYLPKLRGNTGVEESVLFNLFKQVDSSPFNQRKLELWLEEKRKEIALITSWIENIVKDRHSNIMIKPLSDVIGDTEYDYIFCLSFRFVEENDAQLIDMYNYRYNNSKFNSSKSYKKRTKWFEDRRSIAKIRKNLRQFIEFAKGNNVTNGKIRFIVDEEYPVDHVKTTKLILYDDGSEKGGFIIPSKAGAPKAKSITDNNVTLGWADAATGSEKIRKYKVMYRKYSGEPLVGNNQNEKEEKWTEVYTNASHKEIVISNLPSNATFIFKVQSITVIGLSPISDFSEPISTLAKKEQKSAPPLRASSIDIHPNATWTQNGLTVAGGKGYGYGMNQLCTPLGLYVDEDQTIYVANYENHRIMEWKSGATSGKVVAGGNGAGSATNQLNNPNDVIVDKERDSLVICDYWNSRVVRWSRRNGTSGETIISNIDCWGLTMDENGFLYVVEKEKGEVRRYRMGESEGKLVAGGNGRGRALNQLDYPQYVFVDRDRSVYVSDWNNNRVTKWEEGANEAVVVAGGNGKGSSLTQLYHPAGVVVDQLGTVYVADYENHRIMRWAKGSGEGSVIAGGKGAGGQSNQLYHPYGLSFDRHGNLYVADRNNHRVQKFWIE